MRLPLRVGKALLPFQPNGTPESVIISKTRLPRGAPRGGCVRRQSSAPENKLTLMAAFTHHAEPGLPSKGSLENLWLAGHLNLLYGVSSCLQQSLSTFLEHVSAFLHFSILPEQLPEVLVTGFIHFCNSEA